MILWAVIVLKYGDEIDMKTFESHSKASEFYDFSIRELLYYNNKAELAQSLIDIDLWENRRVSDIFRECGCWVELLEVPSPEDKHTTIEGDKNEGEG